MPAPTVTLTSRATRSHFRISRLRPSSLKQHSCPRSFYRDASSISWRNRTEPLRVNFRQRTRVGRGHPQSQQVTLALRLQEILERGSIVQNCVIVHELHIAWLKLHHQVQRRVVRQFVEQIKCLDLKRTERCDPRKAAGRLDVLSLVDRRDQSLVAVEDRNGEIGFTAFGNLTTSVRLNRIEQDSEEVRSAAAHFIEDRSG